MDKASYREANPQLTRPGTGLPRLRVGGQGPYLRSGEHLGMSGMPKSLIDTETVIVTDGPTDGWMDG